MKCSNCGTEVQEGFLYCAKCGGDIHMVPDFEAELELNLSRSISSIAAEVADEHDVGNVETASKAVSEDTAKTVSRKAASKAGRFVRRYAMELHFVSVAVIVCVLGLIVAALFVGVKVWQYHSYDHQLKRAVACAGQGNFEGAEDYYRRALEIDDTDIEISFALAEACFQKGNKIEYEYLLRDIIRNPLCTQEQLERAYGKLIVIYRDREEYDVINEILLASDNEKIKNAYQVYLASPPEFNFEEGYYTKVIPLKLTSATTGRIYYTMDGSDPNSESLLYTAPILLEADTVIKAIVVNEYGVSSTVVSKEYRVHMPVEDEPEVSVISGEYSVPMVIEVEKKADKEVYYTTDGTKPTLQSGLYTGPIPMPLGKSTYCFAYVAQDGTCGKVAQRVYELNLNAEVTVEDAEALVVEYMLILRKIFKEDGTFKDDTTARYLYQYQYVTSIEGAGDYYVVAEVYQDEGGVQSKTGSYYAVNIHQKECYKLTIDENNNYSLVEIILDSPDEG